MPRREQTFNLDTVEGLGAIGATAEEMAVVLKTSPRTVERRLGTNSAFRAAYERGLTNVKIRLRREQIQAALNPNSRSQGTMLVWLGKQLLVQRDRFDATLGERPPSAGPDREALAGYTEDELRMLLEVAEARRARAAESGTPAETKH